MRPFIETGQRGRFQSPSACNFNQHITSIGADDMDQFGLRIDLGTTAQRQAG